MRSDPHAPDAHRPARAHRPPAATTLVTATLIAAALVAASAGCTSTATADPTPATSVEASTPSPAPTPDPTPTPTSTPLPMRPAAMDTVDVNGAIAAVTYFLELYPYVYNTGDAAPMKELSHPECIFCTSATDDAEEMHTLGHHQVGTATRVTSAKGTEINPGYWFSVEAEIEQASWQVLDGEGNVVEEGLTTKDYSMFFAVIHQDGAWQVREGEFTSD